MRVHSHKYLFRALVGARVLQVRVARRRQEYIRKRDAYAKRTACGIPAVRLKT